MWLRGMEPTQCHSHNNTVAIYDEDARQYTPELQRCAQKLLTENVGTNHVGNGIAEVLKLAGKQPNKLPSQGTVRNINLQHLVIAQTKIAEDVSGKQHTTLETDESSKYGQKYGAYAMRDASGRPYVLGLRALATKSAKTPCVKRNTRSRPMGY